METQKDYINRIYNEARSHGICHTQGEFARLLGMNASTISKAMQGDEKYLTANLVKRIRAWSEQVFPGGAAASPQPEQKPDIVIPAATMDLYTSMAKSIDRLSAMVERLMPGASAFTGVSAGVQKNFRTDNK